MRLERNSGIYGATINPANTGFNVQNWEISLFTADLFAENNYGFLKRTSVQNALRHSGDIISITDISGENPPPRDALFLDYFDKKRKMYAVAQARVTGPSFSFRLGENHVIGLVTALRTENSSYRLPEILRYRTISDLPRNQAIEIQPAGFSGMVWSEIGVHYSHRITDRSIYTSFGITPKLLLGMEGFFSRAQSNFDYTQKMGDTVTFGRARWDYGLTTGNLTGDPDQLRPQVQGAGFGVDIGFCWAMPDEYGESAEDYTWRLGISLIDVGFVRFGKSAEKHHIEFDTIIAVSPGDFPPSPNPHDLLDDVSQAFLGDPAASLTSRAFAIGLPAALSVQYDTRVKPHFYVGALLVQRIPLQRTALRRPSTLAVIPRFEQQWWSASLPLVLSDWRSLRVGAAARLGVLYLGTDNLGSFFQKARLTGTDFYIGLKINAFPVRLGKLKWSLGGGGHNRQKLRKIKCYY